MGETDLISSSLQKSCALLILARQARGVACSPAEGGVPHVVPGVKALDFVQLDLGVLGPVHGAAGNPPFSAGQACGQVRASPRAVVLLRPAPPGGNFAVGRLPELDGARVAAEHDGVVPAPYHHAGQARCLSDGYQMAWQHALSPGRRELRCVPDGEGLALGLDLAGILLRTEHDAAAESRDIQGTCGRSGHPSSMPWRAHCSPVFSWRMAAGDLKPVS
jgi:hypothetical protein